MSRRLTVGQRILVPSVGVRFSPAQPCIPGEADTARSSSGLGRRPLKAEITSSNLVRATIRQTARSSSGLGRRPLKAEITSSNLVRATIRQTARSSSGLGRRPLKAEITSSNLVRATRNPQVRALSLACFATLVSPFGIITSSMSPLVNSVVPDSLAYEGLPCLLRASITAQARSGRSAYRQASG